MSSVKPFFYPAKDFAKMFIGTENIPTSKVRKFMIHLTEYSVDDDYVIRYYTLKYLKKRFFISNLIADIFKSKADWNTVMDEDGESLKFKSYEAAHNKLQLILDQGNKNDYYTFFVLNERPTVKETIFKP